MDSFCVQMPATAPMADAVAAGHDDTKLRRALVGGGATKAVAALLLVLSRSSPSGVFLRGGSTLLYAYYAVLAVVALFGGLEVAVGFWVAGDPDRRRGWGRRVMWVSVVPRGEARIKCHRGQFKAHLQNTSYTTIFHLRND